MRVKWDARQRHLAMSSLSMGLVISMSTKNSDRHKFNYANLPPHRGIIHGNLALQMKTQFRWQKLQSLYLIHGRGHIIISSFSSHSTNATADTLGSTYRYNWYIVMWYHYRWTALHNSVAHHQYARAVDPKHLSFSFFFLAHCTNSFCVYSRLLYCNTSWWCRY